MGSTLDIALEKVKVKYQYRQRNFSANIGGNYQFGQNGNMDTWNLSAGLNANISDGVSAYANGNYRHDGSWDARAGLRGGQDNLSWNVETYSAKDRFGEQDSGVRAGLSWEF